MSNARDMGSIDMRRTCCGVPVWMLDTTCSSNSRLSGAEKLRSASMLLATCAQSVDNYERVMTTRGKRTLATRWLVTSARRRRLLGAGAALPDPRALATVRSLVITPTNKTASYI